MKLKPLNLQFVITEAGELKVSLVVEDRLTLELHASEKALDNVAAVAPTFLTMLPQLLGAVGGGFAPSVMPPEAEILLQVTSQPPGAAITVNDEPIGVTPLEMNALFVISDEHVIVAKLGEAVRQHVLRLDDPPPGRVAVDFKFDE